MELYILRHAEAGKRLSAPRGIRTIPDRRGERGAPGRRPCNLRTKAKARPDHISPLKGRCRETATRRKGLKTKGKVEIWDELKPEGSKQELFKRLSKLGPEATVLCVGHEPYLTQAINDIMGHQGAADIVSGRCGLARLSIKSFTPKTEGELRWLLTPRLLKRMS